MHTLHLFVFEQNEVNLQQTDYRKIMERFILLNTGVSTRV